MEDFVHEYQFIIVKNYKEFRYPSKSKWCMYVHRGTSLNREIDTGNNLDESLGNYTEWKKSILKSYKPYASIYTFLNWQNFRNGKLISDCQGKGRKWEGGRWILLWKSSEGSSWWNCSNLDCGDRLRNLHDKILFN